MEFEPFCCIHLQANETFLAKSGPCKRALVQLSYAFSIAKMLSLFIETYGTEQGELTADDVTKVAKMEFEPFCCTHLQAHGKISYQKRSLQACITPTVICFWSRQDAIASYQDLWD